MQNRNAGLAAALALVCAAAPRANSDEGMWLFEEPPRDLLRDRHGFEPSAEWLEHLRLASVKLGAGGSAEFVSEDGLIMSNHHVGSRAIHRLSTPEHNYLRDGFYAATREQEKPCPGLEARVLVSTEDVTARVNAAVHPGMNVSDAFAARRAAIASIEKESSERTGHRSEVVALFQGARYHLYRYRTYSDVRLVFAPEEQIAYFGGDPDNFEFPRFDLDICFFRAYEDGRPARVEHYLSWSKTGALENELVFVSGHPGRTDRLRTLAELEHLRDTELPRFLERVKRIEVLLKAYSERSEENARRARSDLRSATNSRKVRDGTLEGLMDPELMGRKREAERALREAVAREPGLEEARRAWDRIAAAQREIGRHAKEHDFLERAFGFNSVLFTQARQILRAHAERSKPNGERLEEYRDSALESLERGLFAPQPVYTDLEALKLGDSLTFLAEELGYESALVQKVLAGQSPYRRAATVVESSRLSSPDVRKELYRAEKLGPEADSMIALAAVVDQEARSIRKLVETETEAIRQAHAVLGQARYKLQGTAAYPDATSSLRLSFGLIKGYPEGARQIPHQTTIAGLYQRSAEHRGEPPFDLPEAWVKSRRRLALDAPFNFVCTADIIGGNSGSPVVNRQGELVGIIFDGNAYSLTANFIYTEEQSRAVAVHSSGILEALEKVYRAKALVAELEGTKASGRR